LSLKSVKTLTASDIAKKWKLDINKVNSLIDDGAKIEHEHDKSMKNAKEIARDHISERPDYYKKLRKMEKTKISMKEGISTVPEREIPVVGDLTGAPRTIAKGSTKIDEIKMPKVSPKVKKAAKVGMTLANIATLGQVAGDAAEGRKGADPKRGMLAAVSTLPGPVGYGAMGLNYTVKGYDKAREHLRSKIGKKMEEATFQGKKVPLNKPMKGDVKKSKVFVDPDGDGKAQKVNFGDPNMTIKKSNPARRKSFRARHNCDNPGPKTKARYWSCRAWEETQISEDWQSVNRKDKTDGLSQAAVNAYRRENPGSKLQTAVTEKNPSGKRAARRKSFCSRMSGMKKRLTSAKTARDPDSRINKALRRWNCEEETQIHEISAELVGKVSNARFFRGEVPSKVLTRAINKKFVESGKKDKGKGKIEKEVKEAVMAMPPQIQPPAIHGSQRAGIQRQVSKPTSVSGRASGRLSGQGGSMTGQVQVQRAAPPRAPTYSMPSGQRGSMSASPTKTSMSFSQGGTNVGGKMAASKQTSSVVKGMTSAGREAAAVVSKAAPMASRVAGAALRIAGGPAATAAAAVMSPTAANAGENEKKRQETLKSYNPYKAQGRSVSDYEKQALTPQKYDTPKAAAPKTDAPTPPKRPDYFSRGQAFQAARGEAGGGEGKFSYDNKTYQTNVSGEKYKPESQLKQTSIKEETKMDTKDIINEAIDNILSNNLVDMKENLLTAIQEKAIEKLEEKKKEIASNYFAQ
jgi:hypothetical protein